MSEIELKFIVGKNASSSVWQRAKALGYCETTPRARTLTRLIHEAVSKRLAGMAQMVDLA